MESDTTKETSGAVQNYNVQSVMLPILPTSAPNLADPTAIDPVYADATGQITVLMSFKIPGTLNPNQVSIKQYYDSSESSMLYFYAVYNSESTAALKEVNCKFKANMLDAAGAAIALSGIINISVMLMNNSGPKSSRGIVTTVKVTGETK